MCKLLDSIESWVSGESKRGIIIDSRGTNEWAKQQETAHRKDEKLASIVSTRNFPGSML